MPRAANAPIRRRVPNNFASLQQQQPNYPKPWFLGAPISKVLCILWAAGSLWVIRSHNTDSEFYGDRNYDHNMNLWGAAVWSGPSSWVFESTSEMIFGLSFLGHFLRRLEQELSSRRLVAWIILLEATYVFVRLCAVATLDEEVIYFFVAPGFANGPYLFVGGILQWYIACVPRLHPRFLSSTTLGISLSEKSLPYFWALYILTTKGSASLFVGAIGVLASAIYFFLLSTTNNNGTSNIPFVDLPEFVVKLLPWESIGGLFLIDASPKVYAPFITRGGLMAARGGPRRQRRAPQVEPPPVAVAVAVPSPEKIAQLTSMGFEEDRVKEALRVSDNNVERAANILLTG